MVNGGDSNERSLGEVGVTAPQGCGRELRQRPVDMAPLLLTVEQVAQMLGISVRSIWRLASTGELPRPIALGRAKRWERAAIEAYVSAKAQAA